MLHGKKDKTEVIQMNAILRKDSQAKPLPKFQIAQQGLDPYDAYRLIKDELLDEGSARQNLATFCQTYMEEGATKLMAENLEKNIVDKSEYPQAADIENCCINMIANLWHVQKQDDFIGTSTVGSSEGCMLGGMAMKFRWQQNAEALGLDVRSKRPNLVISSGFQVCWEKFCVYWDIEMRTVPVDAKHLSLDMDKVLDYVDEYTIGIVAIQGITYTGKFDNIKKLNSLVEAYNKTTDYKIFIHVDAASGGLFTPFVDPDMLWDFRLPNVVSINTSGHKYGLVYPGVGWILWKDKKYLPEKLVFNVTYLGGSLPTIGINFSRSASTIIAQYYNFIRYGFSGYKEIHIRSKEIACFIAKELAALPYFDIVNDGSNLPIVCWKLKADVDIPWNLYNLADYIRMSGWQVPAYPLPEGLADVIVQRIVIRADFSVQMAIEFVADLKRSIDALEHATVIRKQEENQKSYGFTH